MRYYQGLNEKSWKLKLHDSILTIDNISKPCTVTCSMTNNTNEFYERPYAALRERFARYVIFTHTMNGPDLLLACDFYVNRLL
jgi:hypothetical protein